MVSSNPLGFAMGAGTGGDVGAGAGGAGLVTVGAGTSFGSGTVGAAGPPNALTISRLPSAARVISTDGRLNPTFPTIALVGQSKSMSTRSIRSIAISAPSAPGILASNASAQLVPFDKRMVLPSLIAIRFLLSPLKRPEKRAGTGM